MLKIKNDIDLKELEKFGFKKDYYVDEACYVLKFELGTAYKEEIIIWSKDRSLQTINAIRLMNTLYDLIQARISRKGVDMKVINFIEKIRDLEYKLTFEFRQENDFLKQEIVDNVYAIDLKLLDKEIDNWFVDFEKQMIVIDLEKE